MIRARFEEYAARCDMLPEGSRVLCACSGGADSTALLHLLCHTPGLTVAAAHYNHALRGADADRDERFVRQLCQRLGVELFCGRGDVAAYASQHHLGVEEAARKLRYAFLEETADRYGFDRIATAHHAEDNAETILWNLVRGSGTRGLSGIPPVRGKIIRPLLNVTRPQIEAYLRENGLSCVFDSSNRADDNPRNRIRHHVLPLLMAENPSAMEHIAAAAESLRSDDAYLSALAQTFITDHLQDGALPIPELLALPEPVGARVLRSLCGSVQRKHIEAVYALCRSGKAHAEAHLPGQQVRKEYGRLCFSSTPETADFRREIPFGTTDLPEFSLHILREPARIFDEIHNSFNTFFFKNDSIRGKIFVGCGRGSDSIRLSGRGCTKTLKKLFQEAKLPPAQRRATPVLYDDDGVIAVFGFGIAERCAARPGDPAERIEFLPEDAEKEK
jgi:tRNA(Ile)-lysidine synthase